MTRPIVLSNGNLHVGLNKFGLVHDFYFPYVGLANHSSGPDARHKIGVWVDGQTSWLDDGSWDMSHRYPYQSLVGHTIACNNHLQIVLEIESFVDSSTNAFLRNIEVVNNGSDTREIRLFLHQAFNINDAYGKSDTAQYLPNSNAILHYKGHTAFIVSGVHDNEPFDQHSIGLFGIEGHEGTWRDAEDGVLGGSNVEHGRVDSVLGFNLSVGSMSSERVYYWVAAGEKMRDAISVDKLIREHTFDARLRTTNDWWGKWLQPTLKAAEKVDPKYRDLFVKSAMIIKSQIDNRGAIIASTDGTMLNYDRDAYAYSWPRDGANVIWPLIRMGYTQEPRRFFEFTLNSLHSAGYVHHKFMADGGLGSSWHSYVHEHDIIAPPIQEDETALVLFMLAQFYETTGDDSILEQFYEPLVKPMANWMAEYIDDTTGLPKASYDLWEEVFLTTTYTTAVTYAALRAAADLADAKNDNESAVIWRSAAGDIKTNAHKILFNRDRQVFYKGILSYDGGIDYNDTIESSAIYGAFMFGLFDLHSDELTRSAAKYQSTMRVIPNTDAYPRYENDNYRRQNPNIQGNWWPIVTMWTAQLFVALGDKDQAANILDKIIEIAPKTGVLPEQLNPETGEVISPAPLTWSHAEFLSTVLDYTDQKNYNTPD